MPATLATIDPILKEVYAPRIREQLNQETVALRRIIGGGEGQRSSSGEGVTTDAIGGRYVTFPIHVSRNAGIGSRFEGEALPVPGAQGYAAARVGLKYGYGAAQLTGQTIKLTNRDPKAFARALDTEMTGLKTDILKDMNRQVYGTGNGAIATASGTYTTTNVIPVTDARLAQIGAMVDVIALSSGAYSSTIASNRQITAVSLASGANTITVNGATISGAATNIIVRTGSGIAAAGNRELTGLSAIVDNTSTLFNIAPGTQPQWASVVNSNAGTNRAISESLILNVADTVRTNGGKTTLGLMSLGVRRAYFNLLSQSRSTVNTLEFTGGFKGLAFTSDEGDIPLVADPDAPLNTLWLLNEDSFTFYRESPWDWMDQDGTIWKQTVDANGRYDSWVAYLEEYHELGIDVRNSQAILKDVLEA